MRAAILTACLALAGCGGLGLDLPGGDDAATAGDQAAAVPASQQDDAQPLPLPRPSGAPAEGEDVAAEGEETAAVSTPGSDAEPAGSPAAASAQGGVSAPHIYMAVQSDRGGPVSLVFAIDRSRDNTPSDEPAIRITPEQTDQGGGRCNPQQLRYFRFPPESADRPVYGPDEASRGVGAKELPGFMATAVSAEMMSRGIAEDLEQTRPQNVCTRKLFEQTIVAASTGQG